MGMAERIKERRKIMGYTQTELGEKIGLQASAIAKYENGRVENIKRSIISNMAKVLDCSPSYLMGLDDPFSESSAVLHARMAKDAYFQRLYLYWERLSDSGKDKLVEYATDLSKIYSTNTEQSISRVAEESVYHANVRDDLDTTPGIENPDDDQCC